MKIYLDLLFLLNFIYDALLLITVSVTLKRNTKFKRILLGALFGAISTFIILIPLNKYLLLLLKILAGFLMLLVTYGYHDLKYFLNNMLLMAPFILYLYIKEQNNLKRVVNYYTKVLINLKNNRHLELKAFIDSGNKLQDPITHKYIILINKKRLKGIYNIRSPMYVPIITINKTSLLECIPVKNIEVNGKVYENYLLGLSDTFKMQDGIECLLNYHLIEK